MDFIQRLEELATARGIYNKSQLSEASGVPYTTIDNLYRKNGDVNIKLSTLRKFADFFHCSLDYLLGDEAPSSAYLPSIETPSSSLPLSTSVTEYRSTGERNTAALTAAKEEKERLLRFLRTAQLGAREYELLYVLACAMERLP